MVFTSNTASHARRCMSKNLRSFQKLESKWERKDQLDYIQERQGSVKKGNSEIKENCFYEDAC